MIELYLGRMLGRFFLPDFEFEIDEWQQRLVAGEVTLEDVLQALLDHIQPIVQPEAFEPLSIEAEALDMEEMGDDLTPLLAVLLIRTTAISTRLEQIEQRLSRVESGIARTHPQTISTSPVSQTET